MNTIDQILAKSDPEDVTRVKRLIGETVGVLDALLEFPFPGTTLGEAYPTFHRLRNEWLELYPAMDKPD